MRIQRFAAFVGATMVMSACAGADGGAGSYESAALETDDSKASYGIGLNVGNQIADTRDRLDRLAFLRGVNDALAGSDPAVPGEELSGILQQFAGQIQAAAAAEAERLAGENAAAGEAYLVENGAKEGVTTTDSGLQYEILRQGDGPMPGPATDVRLHYRGTLVDGTEFDSSYDGEPVVFNTGSLIQGFSEALMLMPAGSHFKIAMPPEIGYGPQGSGRMIGPNATLVFEIEVFEVVEG